ncbi:methyltransferase-like protein 25 isoform X1 [Salvelinus namaycush]|uniref:Methyltransferase-like protein 25 isoform X1 n=2 Tax=Salvelinus namaycush TaxID=8040 RepID=A0A8U0R010_SALNM|nr:methyltransferase-like protein 25 isoform X1 [Salvelinus namaycush]
MASSMNSLETIQKKIDAVKLFLSVSLSIANAHTVDFYTCDVWDQFMAVPPVEVLTEITLNGDHKRAPEHYLNHGNAKKITFGFCDDSKRLVDVAEFLEAAYAHSLPGLGVCVGRTELLQSLRHTDNAQPLEEVPGAVVESDEFMNSKKSHEVQAMSEVVASLAQRCRVKQVIDVGSGKGYLCSFLSLRYGLQVYGIDSSSVNTHGAQERNRKLKKYSRAYQRHSKANRTPTVVPPSGQEDLEDIAPGEREKEDMVKMSGDAEKEEGKGRRDGEAQTNTTGLTDRNEEDAMTSLTSAILLEDNSLPELDQSDPASAPEEPFLSALCVGMVEPTSPRVPPSELSLEERERRKRENLDRKARSWVNSGGMGSGMLYSPLTSYVTAETELKEIIGELEDAVMVGLHTCGDLAPSTLRMFVAKRELLSVCSVGCCYHLLSEEFDPTRQGHYMARGERKECPSSSVCGFPLSGYLREQSWFCGRNARMSACLALERVSKGQGIQMESLFYRAVLHVILRDHYSSFKSEKRVGNVYSKATSFVDYVWRALRRLELDGSKLSDGVIQGYHDTYRPRMVEMEAFNMLKVTLAPCIEGLILLDRLCYLKEQEDVAFSTLVQLFDPLLSPRCYGVVGVKAPGTELS